MLGYVHVHASMCQSVSFCRWNLWEIILAEVCLWKKVEIVGSSDEIGKEERRKERQTYDFKSLLAVPND